MKPNTNLDDWIAFTRDWLAEERRKLAAQDEAAWQRFRMKLIGPFD